MRRVLAASRALPVILVLAAGCGPDRVLARGELETIGRLPEYVLTIGDLAARVKRARSDVGVRIEGVQVVGVLVRRAKPCDIRGQYTCDLGAEGKYLFVEERTDPDAPTMSVLLMHSPELLSEGERYVLDGSVELAPDAPQRWQFRGQVLARVRSSY